MAVLSRLPNELVLLVVEHACRGFNYTQPAWVASLCLVCKSVQLTVVPILYMRLFISAKTIEGLEALSRTDENRRLALVREVHFDFTLDSGEDTEDGGCALYDQLSSTLARALTGLHTVCGPSWSVETLAHLNPDLSATVSSLYVTDPTVIWLSMDESKCMSALLGSVARLHIFESFATLHSVITKLSPLRVTGVMLVCDIMLLVEDIVEIQAQEIAEFCATLDSMSDMLSDCRRLLFRPRGDLPECAQFIISCLKTWALGKRDARIWVDDGLIPIFHPTTGKYLHQELDVDDVLAGHSLWEGGRPLCTPETEDCDT
ncbi:hypothetical protein EXIGLDRAFT_763921 [Exidia glandulosa HHB12029]|uniref:F-box domain-containing protein n=1 Tax=Exidia glandulosa HHB12029 TaxID=1314781 RepID=A0A165LMG7_EXIGL|nr:hypothetical protein EXIGLDRAFT_763921 [Exidia glandulosa HHB12029]